MLVAKVMKTAVLSHFPPTCVEAKVRVQHVVVALNHTFCDKFSAQLQRKTLLPQCTGKSGVLQT
jgi:hypothetical protein